MGLRVQGMCTLANSREGRNKATESILGPLFQGSFRLLSMKVNWLMISNMGLVERREMMEQFDMDYGIKVVRSTY